MVNNNSFSNLIKSDPCYFRVNTDDEYYNVSFEITNCCNFKCQHCFNSSDTDSFIGLEKDKLLTLINELSDAGIKNVYITGGEPTKYPYFMDAVNAFVSKGIEVILATNGYELEDYYQFIDNNISKDIGVYISIDGLGPVHNKLRGRTDAFEKATSSINEFVKRGMPVRVSSIIWNDNYNQLEELVSYLQNIGVSQINFTIPVTVGRAKTNNISLSKSYAETVLRVKEIQEQYASDTFRIFLKRQIPLDNESLACQAGQKIMHINSNGEIHPCSWLAKAGTKEYFMQWQPGNLNECIQKIKKFKEVITKRETETGFRGCPAMAKIYNGDLFSVDPLNDFLNK